MIRSLDDAVQLTQGEVGKRLNRENIEKTGTRILAWAYSGFRVLTNSRHPVKTVSNLKDLNIRIPKNIIEKETCRTWGIVPTPLAWSKTFEALSQKTVDGQDNPYITNYVMKFYDVQKYVTNLRYIFSLEPLIINELLFQQQPPEIRALLLDLGSKTSEHCRQFILAQEDDIKQKLVKLGMEIHEPADDEEEFIRKATKTVWTTFFTAVGGREKVQGAQDVLGREFPF